MNWPMLMKGLLESLELIGFSTLFSLLLGFPLGIVLILCREGGARQNLTVYRILDFIVNILRSFPFIILIIVLFPLSRILIGRSVGTVAAIIPLSIAAAPFVARMVEQCLNEVSPGVLEANTAMGSTTRQMIFRVLLPEALPALINGITLTIINIVGYSAMAGAVGGGGLGDLAIRFGLQTKNPAMLWLSILLILLIVQMIQMLGNFLARICDHR